MKFFIFILAYVITTLILFAFLASIGIKDSMIDFIVASLVCLSLKRITGE